MIRKLTAGILLASLILFVFASCRNPYREPKFSIDADGNVIVEYSNGETQIIGNIKAGDGTDGKSISNAALNDKGELILTYSDGTTVNLGSVKGEKDDPEAEDISIIGAQLLDGNLILTFSNQQTVIVGKLSGSENRRIESIFILDGVWYIQYADGDMQSVDATETRVPELPDRPAKELFRKSGRITSNATKTLAIWAEWEAVSYDGKTAQVTVRVGITCWDIYVGARDTGTVTVNGQKKTYSTPPMEYTLQKEKDFRFAEFTFTVALKEDAPTPLEIEVTWPFNGTYSGQKLDILRAAATVTLPDGNADRMEEETDTVSEFSTESDQPPRSAPDT